MTRKKADGLDDVEFTQRVLDVLAKIQAGKPSSEEHRDVRRVAIGLYFIANAVRDHSRIASFVLASGETGSNEALAILAAFKTGEENPIWRYLKGIRRDPQHARANGVDNQRRYIMIGCVRAYHAAAGGSEAKALKKIARECRFPDVTFNAGLIKGWLKRYKEDRDNVEAHLKAIAAYADTVNVVAAATDPDKPVTAERVLEAARKLVGQAWGVPYQQ
jgi:hypothetical protein